MACGLQLVHLQIFIYLLADCDLFYLQLVHCSLCLKLMVMLEVIMDPLLFFVDSFTAVRQLTRRSQLFAFNLFGLQLTSGLLSFIAYSFTVVTQLIYRLRLFTFNLQMTYFLITAVFLFVSCLFFYTCCHAADHFL